MGLTPVETEALLLSLRVALWAMVWSLPGEDGSRFYDGTVGPKTREVIAKAIGEGKIQAVNDSMADKRVDFMNKQPNKSEFPGWLPRAESFRKRQKNSDQ